MSADAAHKRFKSFQGRAAKEGEVVTIRQRRDADAFLVGDLVGVIYKARGDGETYIHRFKKSARPVLYVSADGLQLYALAGAYRFTDRGFVDRASRPKRRKKP